MENLYSKFAYHLVPFQCMILVWNFRNFSQLNVIKLRKNFYELLFSTFCNFHDRIKFNKRKSGRKFPESEIFFVCKSRQNWNCFSTFFPVQLDLPAIRWLNLSCHKVKELRTFRYNETLFRSDNLINIFLDLINTDDSTSERTQWETFKMSLKTLCVYFYRGKEIIKRTKYDN